VGEGRYDGGYTIVKDYVPAQKRGLQEIFIPLRHPPGHGQADFDDALVVISSAAEIIADYRRSYDTGDMVFAPVHDLAPDRAQVHVL